ncbi:hypothetical protein HZS_1447, partial [Henneguya salminicola]
MNEALILKLLLLIVFVQCMNSVEETKPKKIYLDASKHKATKYRRFEIIIGNLMANKSIEKYCNGLQKLKGCLLITNVTFNTIPHTRNIDLESEFDADDGIFLFHTIVWNGEEDETKVFTENSSLDVEIYIKKDKTKSGVYNTHYTNILKTASNTERNININLSDEENFSIYVNYRCMGYTGFNCQLECNDSQYPIDCDYDTGLVFCKNSSFLNPPFCNSTDDGLCPEEEKEKCQNDGICAQLIVGRYECRCQSGYGGEYCEHFYCSPPCHSDYGECVGPNNCSCSNQGKTGPDCNITTCIETSCNNSGKCKIWKNEIICMCDTSQYAGQYCERKCENPCVYGVCSYDEVQITFFSRSIFVMLKYISQDTILCLIARKKIFANAMMDSMEIFVIYRVGLKPKSTPPIEKGFISPRDQKIAYCVVFFLIFLTSLCTFGTGLYMKNSMKRKIKTLAKLHNSFYSRPQPAILPENHSSLYGNMLRNNGEPEMYQDLSSVNLYSTYANSCEITSDDRYHPLSKKSEIVLVFNSPNLSSTLFDKENITQEHIALK